jgi:formyltetrahydrofolate-dependent phosphoribosylglycinamide formyltransferase
VAEPLRVAVLASGGGSNLQALLDAAIHNPAFTIALVASNNPGAGALARARNAGVPTAVIEDPANGAALTAMLQKAQARLVVLAGYLKLVPADTVEAFRGRMINIHPALLPAFGGPGMYGTRVHRAVLEAGVTVSGASVHLVDDQYDRGPVIAQWPVPVLPGDSVETLASRVLAAEHKLLPAVVSAAAHAGKVVSLAPFEGEENCLER